MTKYMQHRINPWNSLAACSIIAAFCLCQGVQAQGTVSAWGHNDLGQLGNGTYTTTPPYGVPTPETVSGLSGVTAIAAGNFHSLALKSDGTLWAWGYNYSGQLGDGMFTPQPLFGIPTPAQVLGSGGGGYLTGVTAVAASFHSLALKSDSTVWTWGYNVGGQLGDGTRTDRNAPVQVIGLSGVTAVAAGGFHSLALKSDGTVWTWGYNFNGQLGNGTYTDSNTPIQVSGLSGVLAIAGGYLHSLALKSDGTVWAWGENVYGELGNGTYSTAAHGGINTPVQVLGLTGVMAIAGTGFHSLALKSDGTVWAWGLNLYGELGNGTYTTTSPDGIATPVHVLGPGGVGYLTNITSIAVGLYDSLALKSDGTVWAWGLNFNGEIATPVQVLGLDGVGYLTGVRAISGGQSHSLALRQATPAPTHRQSHWTGNEPQFGVQPRRADQSYHQVASGAGLPAEE